MAASTDWRKILNNHPILDNLRKFKERLNSVTDVKEWIAVKDGNLFVWEPRDASILTTNLKHQVLKNSGEIESESRSSSVQTLTLNRLPINEVERLVLSPSGSHLALQSRNELIVVQLPQKWGPRGRYEGDKDRVSCKAVAVGERVLLGPGMRLISAEWHPGSVDDSHVTLLTSDNYIRTYDIQRPSSPVESARICTDEDDADYTAASSIMSHRAPGDVVVDFDFGAVVELDQKSGLDLSTAGRSTTKTRLWPVYVLCGDGDVYQVFSCLDAKRPQKPRVCGPLSMYPAAEDNYGSDACTLCVLPGTPPVLVVVTLEGRVYHCVVLTTAAQQHKSGQDAAYEDSISECTPTHALYVYDALQLELSMVSMQSTDDSLTDGFSCLMRLHKDMSQPDRYLCSHGAGLHAVVLPWYSEMQKYTKEEEDDADLPKFSTELQAVVEHLMCTKPLRSGPAVPLLGTCILRDKLLGNMIISLTLNLELEALPLKSSTRGAPPALLSSQPAPEVTSPMKQLHTESFDTHVRRVLHRDVTVPQLKSSLTTDLSPEACLQLLSQTVHVLRQQYIQKQGRARDDIHRRVELLCTQRGQQEEDLAGCLQMKNKLTDEAQQLAEKYQEAADKRSVLVYRLETLLKKLYARLPIMSDAEKEMHSELKTMEDRLRIFKSSVQQLRIKQDYQTKQMEHKQLRSTPSRSQLSKSQQTHLRTLLTKEGDDIADLVQQINQLKVNVDS